MQKVSATELETAELCLRKWVWRYVKKLPQFFASSRVEGNIFHGCCERYLKGEEIFPEGWDKGLTPETSQRMVSWLKTAISEGVLEKRPGGLTEKWIDGLEVKPGIRFVGKVDYQDSASIEDHKTVKNVRYAKSPAKIADDIQMNCYGKAKAAERTRKGLPPAIITLTQNQFIKEPAPVVRRRSAERTYAQLDEYWNERILPLVEKMEQAETVPPLDIPWPPREACTKYGRECEFAPLCSGAETEQTYTLRINHLNEREKEKEVPMSNMSALERLRQLGAQRGVNPPLAAAPAAAPASTAAPQGKPPTVVLPPWHSPECALCKRPASEKHRGWRVAGQSLQPCPVCCHKSQVAPSSLTWKVSLEDGYAIFTTDLGSASAPAIAASASPEKKAYTVDGLVAQVAQALTIEAVEAVIERATELGETSALLEVAAQKRMDELLNGTVEVPIAKPEPAPAVAPPAAVAPVQAAVAPPVTDPDPTTLAPLPVTQAEAPKRGRPRKTPAPLPQATQQTPEPPAGFTLLIGASVIRGEGAVPIEDLLRQAGFDYWAETDSFKRRDRFAAYVSSNVEAWQDMLAGKVVVCVLDTPDNRAAASALVPLASAVYGVL